MRILLIIDEITLIEPIVRVLQEEGVTLDSTYDGKEGILMAKRGNYDVIIIDLFLSGINGKQLCKSLRRDNVWVPILILTEKTGDTDETLALNAGADDFLTRPFSYPVLVARIYALARRGRRLRPQIMQVGDLKLDPLGRKCIRSGNLIDLSTCEFAMLEYLIRRSGQVLSKLQIMDYVWGFNFEGSNNVVEVYISYLRRKVDLPFDTPLIQTVRGVGYRLCDPMNTDVDTE